MSEGFFDWVYETQEFKTAREYVSKYADGRSFEDAICYAGFSNPLSDLRNLSRSQNIRFHDKVLKNVRRETRANNLTIGDLRVLASKGSQSFLTISKIGPVRAKFLYELFKPE